MIRPSTQPDRAICTTSDHHRGPAEETENSGWGATTVLLSLVAIFWISPLALLVITAVRPLSDFVANGPLSWPETFTLTNFVDA